MAFWHEKSSGLSEQTSPRGISYSGKTDSPLELPRAIKPSTLKGCVGTLKDGYVRNVPLPRVPQIQSVSPLTSHESIAPKTGITLPGYLQVPSWIPTLPKIGSIPRFSQRLI
jgi:hypothetical protein